MKRSTILLTNRNGQQYEFTLDAAGRLLGRYPDITPAEWEVRPDSEDNATITSLRQVLRTYDDLSGD